MHKHSTRACGRRGRYALIAATAILAAGCGGGGGDSGSTKSSEAAPPPAPVATNTAPRINGAPAAQASVGSAYALEPMAVDDDGDTLAFSIENRPAWASFNTATGNLSGTPTSADLGVTRGIVISVSDGKASAALPAFSITVEAQHQAPPRSVTLAWDVPTQTADGDALGDLRGYRIHYGPAAHQLSEAVEVTSPGVNRYTLSDLEPGTYYFAIRAVSAGGEQSRPSNIIRRIVS